MAGFRDDLFACGTMTLREPRDERSRSTSRLGKLVKVRAISTLWICASILGCARPPGSQIGFCPPIETMPPRITEECDSLLKEQFEYALKLNKELFDRMIFSERLVLIFTYRDGPAVESICVDNYAEEKISSRLVRAIRQMAKISPPENLSCLANHHAEIHFSVTLADE